MVSESRVRRSAVCVLLLVLSVAACGGRRQDQAATPAPAAAAAVTCAPARPAVPARGPVTLRYGGVDRWYLLTLPDGYDGRSGYPLVLDFHGFKASMALQEARTLMGRKGAARGYIVVTPDALGTPRRWNTPGGADKADDFGFVHALITDLRHRLCVDPRRVYATGHSNGAEFAAFLVCRSSDIFAAVAMVSSTTAAACPAGVAPAVFAIHGTADTAVPYNGGTVTGTTVEVPAARDVVHRYADRLRCGPAPAQDHPAAGVDGLRYTGCVGGTEVVLDTVVGGTHPWPSSPDARADPADSVAGKTFDATGAILDFFDSQRAPKG